ncbi:MAG: alpha/beta hydrolase [Acidobacteria bacterium]|nr:alpha/beta hydrolase [Acidobacteriota bacterium]
MNAQPADLAGKWLGALKAGSIELRVALHIDKGAGGVYTGKLDSIDQGATGIPLDKIVLDGAAVSFESPAVRASYKGTLNREGDEIKGVWSQGGASLPLDFKRVDALPSVARPQEPKKPYPYDEAEVAFQNKDIKLAGTLTLPRGRKGVPAAILISGSGPQDRDESIMGHKPFLVLADHLTRKGIAVLRLDDRGVGGSTGNVMQSTSIDFAADVLAGVALLKTRSEIDASKIGLIGHSEGGIVGPVAASMSGNIAFLVLMAGTGVNGEQVLYEQAAMVLRTQGGSEEAVMRNRDVQKRIFDLLRSEPDDKAAFEKIKAMGGEGQARLAANPWFRSFMTLDPADYLKKVKCPVLALNGELDVQVSAKQNLPAIEKALKEGGNRHITIKTFASLNHLFQTAKTGSPAEYGRIEETIAPAVLDTISSWILEHTQAKGN